MNDNRVEGRAGWEGELFRLLAENVKDYAIFVVDPQRCVLSWSTGAERLLGYGEAEIIGRSADIFFTEEDVRRGIPEQELQNALATGRGEDDRWHVRKSGSRFWSNGVVTPLWDERQRLRGFAKIMRDRTDIMLREEEHERRQVTERFLSEASAVLASSLDYDATLASVVRLCVPTLADWAFIDLMEESGATRRVEVATVVPEQDELVQQVKCFAPDPRNIDHPPARALFFGKSLLIETFTDEMYSRAALSAEHEATMRAVAPKSFIAVPLVARGKTRGVLTLLRCEAQRRYESSDLALAEELGRRAALAVDNARLYFEAAEQNQIVTTVTANATTAIFLMDSAGHCTFMNPSAEGLIGYRFEELRGKLLHECIHRIRPDGSLLSIDECPIHRTILQGGQLQGHEESFLRKDGSFFPARCAARGIRRDGVLVGIVLEIQDISEEKQTRSEIARLLALEKEHTRQLRKLARASLTIHSALSLDSVLRVVTEEARRIIGTHQAVSSMTEDERWAQAINTISLSDKYADWQSYEAEPDGTGIYSLVCRLNRPMRLTQEELEKHPAWRGFGREADRHPPMRGWLAAPYIGRDGRNLGVLQLSDKERGDFTEEDEAILVQLASIASVAIENARLYEALREQDQRKDEFLAMLAHELRNPLAPIRSGLDLLDVSGVDDEVVPLMQHQVEHLVRLVDDLLDVSRIMRGKIELRREMIDLSAAVARAMDTARPLILEHHHELTVEMPDEPVVLYADPVRMAQIIANLLTNAAKYTEDGGHIRLAVRLEDDYVLISVQDNGIGIEPELLPHVFDLFRQSERSIDRSQGGLGIGLTVVRSLVEMHGGTVRVDSAGLGRGSEFHLRLPVRSQPTQSKSVEGAAMAASRHYRVLVVDDNHAATSMLKLLLQKIGGHAVHTAHNGRQALEAAREHQPDLILLDIGLPEMDGYQVARQLRQLPQLKNVLLVALTGYGTADDRRASLQAGFDEHLVKPPALERLQQLFAHPKLMGGPAKP